MNLMLRQRLFIASVIKRLIKLKKEKNFMNVKMLTIYKIMNKNIFKLFLISLLA